MARLVSGHQVKVVEGAELEQIQRDFPAYTDGLVRLVPGNWLLPTAYTKIANKITRTKFRSSDVVIMTPPKCGTTWLQEIIWTMAHNPNLDNPEAAIDPNTRSPMLELDMLFASIPENPLKKEFELICPDGKLDDALSLQIIDKMSNPRVIKTHLPFSLINRDILDTTKVVFAVRDPKDMILSYYHHHKLLKAHTYKGTLDTFINYATDDQLMYAPFWEMVKEAWANQDHANLHFVYYEDLKNNTLEEFKKLNDFLGTSLSDDQLQKIVHYTSFSEMKKRDDSSNSISDMYNADVAKKDGGFLRKGVVGDSSKKFSPAQQTKVDVWIRKNTIKHKLKIRYSLTRGFSKDQLAITKLAAVEAFKKAPTSKTPQVVNNTPKPEIVNRAASRDTSHAVGNVVYQSPISVTARKVVIESPSPQSSSPRSPSPPAAAEAPVEEISEIPIEEESTSVEQPVEPSFDQSSSSSVDEEVS